MNLLDFFRRREKRKKLVGSMAVKPSGAELKEAVHEAQPEKKLGESRRATILLQSPKITEKSSILSEGGVYVFQVSRHTPKQEIKKAVEELYKVKVDRVRVINMPARLRGFGRNAGLRPGYRKALVKLAKGQKIEYI